MRTISDHGDQTGPTSSRSVPMQQPGAGTSRRRLSIPRVAISAAIAAVLVAGGLGYRLWTSSTTSGPATTAQSARPTPGPAGPWFAGYTDVTATPALAFDTPATKAHRDVVLAFVISTASSACLPTWGGELTLDQTSTDLGLDAKVARLQQQGGRIAVSFGGQQGAELATTCTDVGRLAAAYGQVLDRYHASTVDLDLEGTGLSDRVAGHRRADAITKLQADHLASGKSLAVWLTLPVDPGGLTDEGQAAVSEMLKGGVDLAGVNVMTMDYGSSRAKGQSMLAATTAALTAAHSQLMSLYSASGTALSSASAWSKLGATPMIGQNDVAGEVFGRDAAAGLNELVHTKGMGRISMWSLNRDAACPAQFDVSRASDACSGVSQLDGTFADLLSAGVNGRL